MDFQGKAVVKGGPGSPQARVDEQASDLVALLKDFTQHFQVLPAKENSGNTSGSASKSVEASAFKALFQAPLGTKIQPQWQEIDDLYNRMRRILHNPMYMDGERLSHEDEMAVRDVLKYHQKCKEKTGPGIKYIKIQQVFNDHTRCFWVVRVDGTEIDFSYHKCLKEKAAKECPDLLEQYDFLYKSYDPRPAIRRGGACTRSHSRVDQAL